MQTSFSADQLRDPAIADADRVLRTCVHYGFCTATCPTYVLTRDENDSPRGRIDLIRAMLERGGAPEPPTVHHLDRCLSCLGCQTTCAAKVDYARLIDVARAHIESNFRRPLGDRLLRGFIARTLPHPTRLRVALRLGGFARPFARWLPGRLGAMAELASDRARAAPGPAAGVYAAAGERRSRVLLATGCVPSVLGGHVHAAALRVLRRHGCEVVVDADAGCCGALSLHLGREREARELARANIAAWAAHAGDRDAGGVDAIVVVTSGCGTTLKDYGRWPGGEAAARQGALVRDVTEWLDALGVRPDGSVPRYRVAYHDACSLQHGQRVTEAPRRVLSAAGFDLHEVPERHFCCGSAGTFHLLQPELSRTLGKRKGGHVDAVGADIAAAGNLGCIVQINRHAATPIVHTVELVDWATGGPRPEALAGMALRAPRTEAVPPAHTDHPISPPAAGGDVGVW
ncbi:MAG: glycolate oxidase subunit GlcF [Burkholderiales bacterium]|nr:glycolate oxidase subunit GlcF [Burkholderiales bacterium]